MTKSLFALAFACVCGMLAVAVPGVAQSQSVTISGCSSPSFNSNTLVLTCGGGSQSAPVCTWSGTPITAWTTGNTMTLVPNCTNSPTSYAWTVTGGTLGIPASNCQSGATCADKQAVNAPGTLTYSVVATNAVGSSTPALATTVAWADGTGVPTGCAIVPSTQSMGSGGGAISPLVVSCSGGAPATTWAWTRSGTCGSDALSSSATQTDHAPANTATSQATCTYTADVSNAAGHVATKPTATVNVAGVAVGLQQCYGPGLNASPAKTTMFENPIPWLSDSGNNDATSALKDGPMGRGKAYVGVINVPANAPVSGNVGYLDVHEYGPAPFSRWVTVSKTPCDFQQPAVGNIYAQYSSNNVIRFTIGPNSLGYIVMMPGDTWYVNVRVQDPTKLSGGCGTGYCDFAVSMHKPAGT